MNLRRPVTRFIKLGSHIQDFYNRQDYSQIKSFKKTCESWRQNWTRFQFDFIRFLSVVRARYKMTESVLTAFRYSVLSDTIGTQSYHILMYCIARVFVWTQSYCFLYLSGLWRWYHCRFRINFAKDGHIRQELDAIWSR